MEAGLFYSRKPNFRTPGGKTVHFMWPLELTLSWDTDLEFRFGPVVFEVSVVAALLIVIIILADVVR